jgi:ElaB/YqjD/DUF883 family membrane-anchored ribosome-binding protein
MSYIFPSGTKRVDAYPAVQKTAEENEPVVDNKETVADDNKEAVVKDFAFDAIKDLPEIKDKASVLLNEIKEKVEEVAEAIQESVEDAAAAKEKVQEVAAVVGEKVEEKKEEKAEEKKEEKAEGKKEEKTDEKPQEEPTEVEIEIEDDKKDISIPGVEDKPAEEVEIDIGKEVGPEDLVKKSDEVCPSCGKEKCACVAKSKGEFVRLAKLSPKNREAVREYWVALGFPKDYVDAMVKDY